MRIISILICLSLFPSVGFCEDEAFFRKLAETMRTVVLTEDVDTIKSYIGPMEPISPISISPGSS